MIDVKLLRSELNETCSQLLKRGYTLNAEEIKDLEEARKLLQVEVETLQSKRNKISKIIGERIQNGDQEGVEEIKRQVSSYSNKLENKLKSLSEIKEQFEAICLTVPNLPDDSVPQGKDETENVVISHWGEPKNYSFDLRDHVELGEMGDGLDFVSATKISGSRFIVIKGQFARLHRAIAHFMLDLHTKEHKYTEMYVPYLVNSTSLIGTGQLPKFRGELFHTEPLGKKRDDGEERGLSLIPTSEVPLTNMVRDLVVDEECYP